MPLFLDIHEGVDAEADEIIEAHKKDLDVQDKYDVEYKEYWYDEDEGAVFCLFEAPNKEAGKKVHKEAHGLTANKIHKVKKGK